MSNQIDRHQLRYAFAAGDLGVSDPAEMLAGAESAMPPLDGATAWLNSPPLTTEGLRGKVVLVNFCTYTCINWLRTLPYVRAWAEKYADRGLTVIGVHTPEFAFEHEIENVRRAVRERRITYPIAMDNAYAIWGAFENHYWPALYFVDALGQIRHRQFGEGNYEDAEATLRQLLEEAGIGGFDDEPVAVDARDAEVAPDWDDLESPETYLGYERAESFASPGDVALGRPHVYTVPARLGRNQWALAGDWTMGEQAVAAA